MVGLNNEIEEKIRQHNERIMLFSFVVGATKNGKISIPVAVRQFKAQFGINKKQSTLERIYFATASQFLTSPEI